MPGKHGLSTEDRFMQYVAKAESGCWLWMGGCMPRGYGLFKAKTERLAHRTAYSLFVGPLDDRDVMHACDNPRCVNPAHLSLGTRSENMQDAVSKDRLRRGASHGRAKLTETQAREVLASTATQSATAARYGITQTTVSQIKSGKKWRHLHEGN